MAAYAAAVSLMHILDLLKNHPSLPISFDKQLHSLTEIITFFQEFLEGYVSPFSYSDKADPLEMRIAEAVHAAEDVIESYIVDSIHLAAASTTEHDDSDVDSIHLAAAAAAQDEDEQIHYINFYEGLQKVIEAMDLIKKEAMEIEMDREKNDGLGAELQENVSTEGGFKSSSIESKSEMVGFDAEILQLKERLVGGYSNREIIPIVGMGGMGKTTLTRHVFADKLIKEHFDVCLWATISQDYNIEQTLREVMSQSQSLGRWRSGVAGLGEGLYKYLYGRRYLVVMDDMWSIEVWDRMKFFFPDCGEGSRIIVTTRMSSLASHLTNSNNSLCMSFLNKADSWTLFSKTVFGSEGSDPVLELQLREIGKRIVGKCKGLPLSIAVIGGLLATSKRTQGYWEYVEKNLSSIVNLDNEEYCLRVLKLSYNHLPAYLKPCFLYMGVFDEDSEIKVSTIIKLWVSEGFVKPRKKKKLETVAREYLQELVDRNLVLAHELKSSWFLMAIPELGSVDRYKMHDLVRDVCLREAQQQRFYHMYSSKEHNPPSHHSHRRIVIPKQRRGIHNPKIMLESSPNPRSYICHDNYAHPFLDFRLLRTVHAPTGSFLSCRGYWQKELSEFVNARLLAVSFRSDADHRLHSSISRLWSLHTLIVHCNGKDLQGPVEFWNMHQLKHVEFENGRLHLQLPPPNNDNNHIVIMEDLHTLVGMKDFHLNEDVVRRMPNLTIFDVRYEEKQVNNREVHCLSYLQRLSKLESFRCYVKEESGENLQMICFPQSLTQILLEDNYVDPRSEWGRIFVETPPQIEWEDVLQKIGRLPLVEELTIQGGFFRSRSWETIESHFPKLKRLQLIKCGGLEKWTVSEASYLPLLQKLILENLEELEEIPLEIGEIATLKSIQLKCCSRSAVLSTKKIVEEQEELYGEDQLSFCVRVWDSDEELESLASPNFQVGIPVC
ncbi:hypothetical protein OROMI_023311 [Orobanche minor]